MLRMWINLFIVNFERTNERTSKRMYKTNDWHTPVHIMCIPMNANVVWPYVLVYACVCVYLLGVGVTHFLEVVRAHLINTNFPKWPKLYKVYGTILLLLMLLLLLRYAWMRSALFYIETTWIKIFANHMKRLASIMRILFYNKVNPFKAFAIEFLNWTKRLFRVSATVQQISSAYKTVLAIVLLIWKLKSIRVLFFFAYVFFFLFAFFFSHSISLFRNVKAIVTIQMMWFRGHIHSIR